MDKRKTADHNRRNTKVRSAHESAPAKAATPHSQAATPHSPPRTPAAAVAGSGEVDAAALPARKAAAEEAGGKSPAALRLEQTTGTTSNSSGSPKRGVKLPRVMSERAQLKMIMVGFLVHYGIRFLMQC